MTANEACADEPAAGPLTGVRILSTAVNVPGPVAVARLVALGAEAVKVEPPDGDPLEAASPAWYEELSAGQQVVRLDLKDPAGRDRLEQLLAAADALITSSRARALERLGLGWEALHARHPGLCHVAVVGHPAPADDLPGHDLTYQAALGLLGSGAPGDEPRMPVVLLADLAGAERAVTEALAALLARGTTGTGSRCEVALSDAAETMAAPLRHGLTVPGGALGGGHPAYRLYAARHGHVAVACLEPHFLTRLLELLEVTDDAGDLVERLAGVFGTRTASEWEAWGREHDLPLAEVRRGERLGHLRH
ncbi:Crotonobetainyl-CoA:carnitine CoA-transferase CaiB [Pedococcus cremeus]|uniref:Crotonobetainyl-CoA:carnitine CoA-transferase CaiB n=1 Tax=Pedococcus cremeus TaxID=587636 RepID=A0A1H9X997_9MICO|nr:CoA transferase [Pedococcus cremeus]SES42756.1 Crotonobetainyl-CoA:carnitine CoA-transferase CaiB [Pedococcus cremeus]